MSVCNMAAFSSVSLIWQASVLHVLMLHAAFK